MYRWGVVLVLGLAVACVKSEAVPCGELVCPVGFVCDPAHTGCALAAQADACEGMADLAVCSYGQVTSGVCSSGICLPAGCGNGIVEDGEACDDRNNLAGDDCSADCSSTEACGNGIIDPVNGESCDDGNTVSEDGCQENCVTPSCGDGHHDDGEGCDLGALNSDAPNAACRTNCQERRCGDDVTDDDEVCDDGNQLSGDGCSFDCDSGETCGNGYIDFIEQELCDDGDSLSHDGCGSCLPESFAAWRSMTPTANVTARSGTALAYDAARGQLIMFGGSLAGTLNDETWAWDGTRWSQQPRVTAPSPRFGHAMVYDPARRVIVLFGGANGPLFLNDLWEWNGRSWTQRTPQGELPPGRFNHGLAYDAARKKVVLFGGWIGQQSSDVIGDTWEWDGTSWTNLTPATPTDSPSARQGVELAYDPVLNKTVLFGGTVGFAYKNDTWLWNGSSWTDVTPASGNPTARSEHAMAFDPTVGRVVIYGGENAGNLGDTHEWNGAAWVPATDASPPAARWGASMAFDAMRGRLVLFGGNTGSPTSETWERVGADWSDVTPSPLLSPTPTARSTHAMAWDSLRATFWVFGGRANSANLGDIHEWDRANRAWHDRTPMSGPSPRNSAAMAYDPVRDRLVLFGGYDNNSERDDTWEWNGASWEEITPATSAPSPRYLHAMAYDPLRQRVVLVGGRDGSSTVSGSAYNDVWEWDGVDWASVGTGPATGRFNHSMVFDAARGRLVVFGGRTQISNFVRVDETWERQGTTWMNATPLQSPRPRFGQYLAYDAHRGRVLMFGGVTDAGSANDFWEYNGTAWSPLETDLAPTARYEGTFGFDQLYGELLMFGGYSNVQLDQTVTLRYDSGRAEDGCHAIDGDFDGAVGCGDHDCYAGCTGACNPTLQSCPATGARCGDSVCGGAENARLCPADCGQPAVRCGDYFCEGAETMATCAGDCTP